MAGAAVDSHSNIVKDGWWGEGFVLVSRSFSVSASFLFFFFFFPSHAPHPLLVAAPAGQVCTM